MRLYLLAVTTFVLFLSTQVGVPSLPRLSAELGASPQEMAAVLSSALMTLVVLQFFSGILADRFGRRKVVVLGVAMGGLTSLLCAIAPSWHALLLLRILGGAADAVVLPALLGLAAEIAADRQGTFFGVFRGAQGLSFLVAPAIGGWFSLHSLRTPFVVDGVLSLVACSVLSFWVSVRSDLDAHHRIDPRSLAAVFVQPRVYAFALFSIVNNLAFPVLSAFVPVKAQGLGYAAWQIAVILGVEAAGFTVASILVGRLSDSYGRRIFAVLAQPLVLLACLGLAVSRDLSALVGWYGLYGLAGGSTFLIGTVMMADITPPARAATTLGMFDAAIDVAMFLSPAVALPASGLVGVDRVLALAGFAAVVAFPVALAVGETRGERSYTS